MTNQEKRLAKDMYRNFVEQREKGTLHLDGAYKRIILMGIKMGRMRKEMGNLERKLSESKWNEMLLLKALDVAAENERKLIEIVEILVKHE